MRRLLFFQIRWVRGDSYLSDYMDAWIFLFVRLGPGGWVENLICQIRWMRRDSYLSD